MKKKSYAIIIAGLLFFSLPEKTSAGKVGGSITYEHVAGLTYNIYITLYATGFEPWNGSVDRPTLDSVHIGNDVIMVFHRDYFVDIGNGIRVSYYSEQFTFSSPGNYTIYFVDPNRIGNIANIPNSFFTPFSIRTELNIDHICPNSSIKFADLPLFYGQKNKIYVHSPAILNPDHDSLTFEIDTCLGEDSSVIPGAFIPPGFTLDPVSGEITSDGLPDSICIYSFAIKVTEWKNGIQRGSVMHDYAVEIRPDTFNTFYFDPLPLMQDTGGNYFKSVNPYDTLTLNIQYTDSSTFPELNVYSEAMNVGNPATVNINSGTSISASAELSWIPDPTHSRSYPYIFTFRCSNDFQKTDLTVLIYVNGPKPDSCYTSPIGIEELSGENDFIIYPNPTSENLTMRSQQLSFDEIEIYNALGERVHILSTSNGHGTFQTTIDVRKFARGIYMLKATAGEKTFFAKFIKE